MRRLALRFSKRIGAAICLLIVTFYTYNFAREKFVNLPDDLAVTQANSDAGECKLPDLPLRSAEIDKFFFDVPMPNCSGKPDWFHIDKLKFIIDPKAVQLHGNITCDYTHFWRQTDYKVDKKTYKNWPNNSEILGDFGIVECTAADATEFRKVFATVKPVELPPQLDSPNGLDVNVILVAFDSISRLTFMRKMPETYEFLTSNLSGVVLEGYNIVGDGTPQALIPILTGSTEPELPLTRKRYKEAQSVNVYPFVWQNFSKLNWATVYGEDSVNVGTFTYRLKGFDRQPTTHLLTTYYIEAKTSAIQCQGAQVTYEIHFDYIKRLFEAYPNRRKFAFTITDLSHDKVNQIGIADGYMKRFLSEFKANGWLNDTLMLLLSDHGSRFSGLRATQQGKLEERLPFVAVLLPDKLERKYPEIRKNLVKNAKRLTTPFDLHATIDSVLNFRQRPDYHNRDGRGISLFEEIPKSRSCAQAAIDPHWCSCLDWQNLTTSDPVVNKIAQNIVETINGATEAERINCVKLTLCRVNWALRYEPKSALLKYKGVKDQDGFVPDLSASASITSVNYQIGLTTTPGESAFEATVDYQVQTEKFQVDIRQISITTAYAHLTNCIAANPDAEMKKYCVCKH